MDKTHHAMVIVYALSLSADIIVTITVQNNPNNDI